VGRSGLSSDISIIVQDKNNTTHNEKCSMQAPFWKVYMNVSVLENMR